MAGLMGACATAGAASEQAANKATSGAIQRFMTVPFSLARVWTGSEAGSRRGAGVSAVSAVSAARFRVLRAKEDPSQHASTARMRQASEASKSRNMGPIRLCETRRPYATTLLSLVKRPPRLCLYSPRAAWDLLFWRCPIALVLLRGGKSMAEYDLVIRNTTIATAADVVKGDIGIVGGRVVALGERLDKGRKEIDATGLVAVPGGIDAHVHFDQDTADGSVFCDDFESGSRAAAAGGTTTIIPFAYQSKGQSLRDAVNRYHKRAEGKSLIDYAFHVILSDPSEKIMGQDFPALVADGYTSFKVYMTYDDVKLTDREMLDALAASRREQAMLMIHAENSDCIGWLTERLELKGMTAAKFHATSRPFVVEREATHRAISLAELLDVPMLLVHVSSKEAMHEIQRAQARGLRVYGETCPQYLFLSEEDFEKPGDDDRNCVCSPPPRGTDNQEHIWTGLSANTFHVLSSDHAAFKYDDVRGKKLPGADKSFRKIPNGVPGVETRLPLLFSEGVNKGRLSLQQFVALSSTNAAKIYGLHPRKGTIAVGADADIVLWDPKRRVSLTNSILHHNCDYTPYEGRELTGYPVMTLSRGEVVMEEAKMSGSAGRGLFQKCDRPEAARPRGKPLIDPSIFN